MSVLPDSRNTTYNGAVAVKSGDLNDIQDCIVDDKHGKQWRWFGLDEGIQPLSVTVETLYTEATADAGVMANQVFGLRPGDVIYTIKARVFGSAAAGTTRVQFVEKRDLASAIKADLQIVDPPAAWATYSLTLGTPYVVLDDYHYTVTFLFGKTGRRIGHWGIEVGRP